MSTQPTSALPPVGDGDHVVGADSPQLTLVEYGDFGCPHCFQAMRPVRSLIERFEGLRLVWRHLPDPELHPGADLAAELSELAATRGRFWDAHGLLLAGRETFSREGLLSVAEQLDMDPEEAAVALDERTFRDRITAMADGGHRAGARGTPTFFVGAERMEGPWRRLAEVVPERLQGANR